MKSALLQLNVSDDPRANLPVTVAMVRDAAAQGAHFVLTPEVTNCLSTSREHQRGVLQFEEDDITLAALREVASDTGIWLLIGSLALKTEDDDGRFANRSFLIAPDGSVAARYDKIHMFDVQITESETYRESAGYRPGTQAVVVQTSFAKLGMSICYDMRFPLLYQALATAGAQILTGCFVLAPAQTGTHASKNHKTRDTYGHSLVVDPWGEVILDAKTEPGVYIFDLNMEKGEVARQKVPSLANRRSFSDP